MRPETERVKNRHRIEGAKENQDMTTTENMTASGFGKTLQVSGGIYRDGFDPNPLTQETKFFAFGDRELNSPRWEFVENATLTFQEMQAGKPGQAQYVPHRYAAWNSVKVVSLPGPGNIHDRSVA